MIIFGLDNPYNLCYLNSILQLLFRIKPLNEYLMNNENEDKIIRVYKSFLKHTYSIEDTINDNEVMETIKFKECLGVTDDQYDTHEILMTILNMFHDSLKKKNPMNHQFETKFVNKISLYAKMKWYLDIEEDSIINDLFRGQLRNKITCTNCFRENNVFESFLDLTLPMDETLEKSMNKLFYKEIIDYYCEKCKNKHKAEKEMDFWKLPKYIIIHLKRFNNDSTKDNRDIIYPLDNLIIKDTSYTLLGLIRHHGEESNHGHYTTTIFTEEGNLVLDDENISANEEYITKPYILLYCTNLP
jgi:ubiquitin carboxyl-terminal hydrolase 2